MRCAKYHRLIGDYLDGTIRPEDRSRLEDHLRACPECREMLEDFEKIAAEAGSLPKDEPDEDVWPAIRAGVQASRRARRSAPARPKLKWAWAAGFLFLGAAIGLVVGLRPWAGGAASGISLDQRQTVAKLQEAERHYQAAIQAMTEALGAGRNGLDPQLASLFKSDLKVVDAAIESCRAALVQEPASLEARVYLLSAYQKKVEVLNGLIDWKKKTKAGSTAGSGL